MKFRAPLYYKEFHCIADKCKDSCCSAGWEIDIDPETAEFYNNVNGSFGEKLRKNISNTSPCHFILNGHNNCPFLNDKKLCDIYINLGEEHLCQICKDHPRYYEWFDEIGVKEAGIGLCCEEAARIILSNEKTFEIYEEEYDDRDINNNYNTDPNYNFDLYNYIFGARDKIIKYLDNADIPFTSKLRNVLWYGHTLQQNIDYDLLDDEEIINVDIQPKTDIRNIINYLASLEPNDANWPEYLRKQADLNCDYKNDLASFEASNPQIVQYLKNIAIYFIWRYFMKAVFDGDVLSEVKLMYASVLAIKYLLYCKWLDSGVLSLDDCIEIVKKYSEEVEYSEDNLMRFSEDSYGMAILETEYLLRL